MQLTLGHEKHLRGFSTDEKVRLRKYEQLMMIIYFAGAAQYFLPILAMEKIHINYQKWITNSLLFIPYPCFRKMMLSGPENSVHLCAPSSRRYPE
ncbi:MAG: hypothetical protein KJ737_01695 [Proteobacteria bacterium]|nr:hypothetical protein [Pseudomonadota bacterium]